MVYILVVIFLFVLSYHFDYKGYTKNRNKWYRIAFVIFVLVAGLRYRIGLDTMRYMRSFYYDIPTLESLSWDELMTGRVEPLYALFVSIIKTVFGKFYFVQLFHAIIVEGLIFRYIKKHTPYIFSTLLIFFIWSYLNYETEEMRASLSIVLCLYACDYAKEKHWIRCELLVFVAFLFHSSAIVLSIIPFFSFLRFNRSFIFVLSGMFAVGIFIQQYFGDLVDYFSFNERIANRAEHYAYDSSLSSQTVNLRGILNILITNIFYIGFAIVFMRKTIRAVELKKVEPFAVTGMLFAVLSIPVSIFYRYVHFFQLFFIILMANYIIEGIRYKRGALLKLSPVLVCAWFFPFFFFILYSYLARVPGTDLRNYSRYYPYASIIEQDIDSDREYLFDNYNAGEIGYYLY